MFTARSTQLAVVVVTVLALAKLAAFAALGPFFVDDGHSEIARRLADGPWDWLRHTSLEGRGWTVDTWRTIGYGAFLALCKLIFGSAWVSAAITVQVVVRAACSLLIFRVAYAFVGRTWLALLAVVAYETGEALLLDISVYPDSLFSSLFMTVLLFVVEGMRLRTMPSWRLLGGMGVALALALALKEGAAPLALIIAGLALFWSRRSGRGWFAAALAAAVVLAPLALTGAGFAAWNHLRTGKVFVTLSTRTALVLPLAGMAAMGVPVFDRDEPIDQVARQAMSEVSVAPGARTLGIIEQWHVMGRVNYGLAECCGYDGFTINDMVSRRYREVVVEHPLGLLNYMSTANHWHVLGLFRPTKSIASLYDLKAGTTYNGPRPTLRAAVDAHDPAAIMVLALHGIDLLVSLVLFAGFFLLFPARLVGAYRHGPVEVWPLWLAHLALIAFYSAVSLENRYLMPTLPGAEIVAVAMLGAVVRQYRKAKGSVSP